MNARTLPIYEIEGAFLEALGNSRRLVVKAPTGSGKSTQIPQMICDRFPRAEGQVVVLQPRRIAARMLARRVAGERGVDLGGEVGYQVRFENVAGPGTRIRYVTEGILLREMVADPGLAGIGTVIFDEFHERHLYGDVTLGHCLSLQESSRPDLAIIVMSATVDTALVESFLQPCTVLVSEGRTFPVDFDYLAKPADFERTPVWEVAVSVLEPLASGSAEGDILVFMPGSYEINRTVERLRESPRLRGYAVHPLHGELPVDAQDLAVAQSPRPKIVVATNVAESSLTIDGIRLVVDSGLARIPRYDPHRGINTLLVQKISQASAEQRAGRAGRTAAGRCVRLWTRREQSQRPLDEVPEILRLDIAEIALTLKALGVRDLAGFRWIQEPDTLALERAETLLLELGAVDRTGSLTATGRNMLAFPVHPRFSRMLLAAEDYDCVNEVVLIAALTQGRPLLSPRPDGRIRERRQDLPGDQGVSDFFLLMNAWHYAHRNRYDAKVLGALGINGGAARQADRLRAQFTGIAQRAGLGFSTVPAQEDKVRRCILTGFVDHLAIRLDEGSHRCALVHGRSGELSRESVVRKHPLFVAAELTELESRRSGQKKLNVQLNLATAVEESWLMELYPEGMGEKTEIVYDPELKRVVQRRQRLFRDLVLESRTELNVPKDAAARILAAEIVAGRVNLPRWDETVERWICRVNCLAAWRPDWEIPEITGEARTMLLEQICLGARSSKDLKDKPVLGAVKSWLPRGQQDLVERFAPERILLPGGRKAPIAYRQGEAPRLSATIQDLYGLERAPTVADGRVRLLVEILAPNRRPVQVTEDLASFWREGYPAVKKQLQRRYSKHLWK